MHKNSSVTHPIPSTTPTFEPHAGVRRYLWDSGSAVRVKPPYNHIHNKNLLAPTTNWTQQPLKMGRTEGSDYT